MTNSKKAIGVRMTEWEYQEWVRLGGTKWLRQQLLNSKRKQLMVKENKVEQNN
jgi:hypothetical protein